VKPDFLLKPLGSGVPIRTGDGEERPMGREREERWR